VHSGSRSCSRVRESQWKESLCTPAARLVGAMWEDDTKAFAEVTLGVSTLQNVVHVRGRRSARHIVPIQVPRLLGSIGRMLL
jgi:hypothetical protein